MKTRHGNAWPRKCVVRVCAYHRLTPNRSPGPHHRHLTSRTCPSSVACHAAPRPRRLSPSVQWPCSAGARRVKFPKLESAVHPFNYNDPQVHKQLPHVIVRPTSGISTQILGSQSQCKHIVPTEEFRLGNFLLLQALEVLVVFLQVIELLTSLHLPTLVRRELFLRLSSLLCPVI